MSEKDVVKILATPEAASRISRRMFLAGASVTAVGSSYLITGCGGDGEPAGDGGGPSEPGEIESELNMYTWGEYDNPKVLKRFTQEVGPKLQVDSYGSNEELIAKLVAAKGTSGFDIVVPTGNFIPQMVQNDLLEELDLSRLPNFANVDPAYADQPWDPGNAHSVVKAWGSTGYAYDSSKIDREMASWQDFLDVATTIASGQTSVVDDPNEIIGIWLWANGHDPNTNDEAILAEAEDYLVNTLATHIKKFDSYPGGGAMAQGAYYLAHAWNGDARQGILDGGDQWKWVLPSPHSNLWMDNWCIPKGAPNPNAAYAFIDFVLDTETSLQQLEFIGYHTGVKDIQSLAEAAGMKRLDIVFFTPEQTETLTPLLLTESQTQRVEIWNKMKAAAGA